MLEKHTCFNLVKKVKSFVFDYKTANTFSPKISKSNFSSFRFGALLFRKQNILLRFKAKQIIYYDSYTWTWNQNAC